MLKKKLPIFLQNTLLLYIPLLALTDGQNDRERKHSFTLYPSLSPYRQTELQTEKQIHSLRVGWRNLFSSCAVASVFCSGGKYVLVLHTPYVLRVPYSCGVVLFFLIWREIVFGTYVISVQYSCEVVSVFLLWRES